MRVTEGEVGYLMIFGPEGTNSCNSSLVPGIPYMSLTKQQSFFLGGRGNANGGGCWMEWLSACVKCVWGCLIWGLSAIFVLVGRENKGCTQIRRAHEFPQSNPSHLQPHKYCI